MQVDDQRITKKDAVFDNVKILNGNQIPLTSTLTGKLPLRGSLIALKSGNIHDLYYGDGLQWVPITDGGSTADPPLVEVLAAGNVTGGFDIISETDGLLAIRSIGSSSQLLIQSQGTGVNALDIRSLGEVNIDSANGQLITIASDDQLILQTTSTAANALLLNVQNTSGGIDINAGNVTGGIDMDAGSGGIAADTSGQLALTSSSATADAVRINASNAGGGGIDIDAGDGGIAVNTTGAMVLGSSNPTTLENPRTIISGTSSAQILTLQTGTTTISNGSFITPNAPTDVAGTALITAVENPCTVMFSSTYNSIPSVVISPRDVVASDANLYISAITAGSFTVTQRAGSGQTGNATFTYIVIDHS